MAEKWPISLEKCRQDLIAQTKAFHPLLFVCCLCLLPVIAIAVVAVREGLRYVSRGDRGAAILPFVTAAILVAAVAGVVVAMFLYLQGSRKLKNREVCFVQDTLTRISREYVRRRRMRNNYMELKLVFYFTRYGRFVPSGDLAQYAERDDRFYLLVYMGDGDSIIQAYNAKFYEVVGPMCELPIAPDREQP